MRRIVVSVALLILIMGLLMSQFNFVSAQNSQKLREATVKKEGWLVPGRNDFRQELKVFEKDIDGICVIHRILKSPSEIVVDVTGRKVKLFAKRKSNDRIFSVREFSVYEAKGRIFAYSVSLVPLDITRRGNLFYKSYIGVMYDLFYLDEDGDGIFESKYSLSLPKLPDWVRRTV
jgi:hypothetical protein